MTGPTKNQTSSPTGWLRMHVWRMSLRRTKNTIISWDGSNLLHKIYNAWLYQISCAHKSNWFYVSHVVRKPVFGVCDQVRLKLLCSATETSYRLEILDIETRGIILPQQWITKVLIRLRGCTGWSAPLLFAYGKKRVFSWGGSYFPFIFR